MKASDWISVKDGYRKAELVVMHYDKNHYNDKTNTIIL